jgi:hypothetical protein
VPELLRDIHELAGPMVCAPAAVRSFLHSSEEYILAIEQARVEHMIHNTRHCVHPTEIGAILMGVSENEILFLHYYHINQPFLRRQLISILTDRQTEVFVTGVKHHIHIAATPFFIHLLYV